MPSPVILMPVCQRVIDQKMYASANQKYIDLLADCYGMTPLLLPHLSRPRCEKNWAQILSMVDGVLIPGSNSNVHPSLAKHKQHQDNIAHLGPFDHDRDRTTLPMIHEAMKRNMPILAICRGMQELNVALGGTLQQLELPEVGSPERPRHEPPADWTLKQQYALSHRVFLTREGLLAQLLGKSEFMVNSYHRQAVCQLAPKLQLEASAPDGVIEAVSAPDYAGFLLAVQWHPETDITDPHSRQIFDAFEKAIQKYRQAKKT